ncbi:8870_t:CDS:1 [Funneliformis geosporum]|uniref:5517_t:CDS:1 n=1 Tax=Funneliformis geosporum TaxID=1117311 RepID=A0A9W4WWM2_9GLOM|nr:5517_t:CDS:1 [Funneliformis geosporum]CAI2169214.1 8870_t:CDS:1 [Funneliformis geosporum]
MSSDLASNVHKDISYVSSPNPLQKLDLYLPPHSTTIITETNYYPPVIVFIHGGAWRTGDKNQFIKLGQGLSHLGNCAVAIVNYRLTTKDTSEIKNPLHVQDVAAAISWISLNAKNYGYRDDRIYLVGNSAGAFISGQIILNPEYLDFHDSNLLTNICGVIGIEGIYDLVNLLRSNPNYIEFVEPAFGADEMILKSISPQYIAINSKIPPYLIIHSVEDELVEIDQSNNYLEHIKDCGAEIVEIETSLKGKHDEIVQSDELIQRMVEFILNIESKEAGWSQFVEIAMKAINFPIF